MRETKYLIIGNSAAGIGGVTGIRSVDPEGEILLISSEKYHTYSRPLISYWLEGKVEKEQMIYRNLDFYTNNKVDLMLGTTVTKIDTDLKKVTLDNGEIVAFEKLLLATGSHPFVPPIAGKEGAVNTFTFTTMDDALAIHKVLTEDSKVVILGAGLIGLKAAEAMLDTAANITVVDMANRVLPSVLDPEAGEMVASHLQTKGVHLKLETSIVKIGDRKVELNNGETLPYDVLILAVGTRPATELAEKAGLATERGIVTDIYQLTSQPTIYAAGDCTQSYDITSRTEKNMAILPNAYLQGEVAGINMAGGNAVYEKAFPLNSMGLMGLYMLTAGTAAGEAITCSDRDSYKKFYIEDNVLRGFIVLGECQRGGIYTDLIREQIDLSTLDFDGLMKEPKLSAFTQRDRFEKLSAEH